MITIYLKQYNKIIRNADTKLFDELGYDDILWIDMLLPTIKEQKAVENFMEISLQTKQQVEEIESTSKYSENENSIISNSNFFVPTGDSFIVEPVSFIISNEGVLVSVRSAEFRTFRETEKRLQMNYRSYDEAIENLQLKPGKLISINQVNAANCRRAVAAGMCIDIMASDKIVFASDMTDERLDGLFAECGEAIRSTKADFWGLHLPYQTYDISSTNENTRVTAVLKLKRLIELTIEHLRPQHFVIHPNTGTILTTGGDFAERTAQSRKSLAELQRHIESCNAQHGTKAILCVENCARSLAYDGDSLLDLLDAEGLEKVRVCLDTGHALIPLNGKYIDPVCNGDALDVLRRIGTRLGTLHIQQNPGALDPTDPKDKHLEPFSGGLIDWGEFYYELLKNNRYRGCFLYEVSFKQVYDGDGSTIESAKSNYTNLIYPAFVRTVAAKK